MAKLTFDEAMERINDQRIVHASDVLASALNRVVWVAEWHYPGCLSESQNYCTSKKDAIASACFYYDDSENGIPRGMATSLRKHGRFDKDGTICQVYKLTLADLL